MNIIDYLEQNGWKILRQEESMMFAKRKSTGKLGFFISRGDGGNCLNDTEILRVWTKKDFHPFVYSELNGKLVFYDFLFNEFVKNP